MTNDPPITEAKRDELQLARRRQQDARRQRIEALISILSIHIQQCPHARDLKHTATTGCLSFRYNGKRVQYWVGAQTLLIRNAVSCVTHNNYIHRLFIGELQKPNPHDAFKIMES